MANSKRLMVSTNPIVSDVDVNQEDSFPSLRGVTQEIGVGFTQIHTANGDPMAVLVRISATGMDQATYDQMSPGLHELVKKQPGFIIHIAYPLPGGFGIGEVWESEAHHDAWFNEHVKPKLPASNAMSTEYIQLHAVVQP